MNQTQCFPTEPWYFLIVSYQIGLLKHMYTVREHYVQ